MIFDFVKDFADVLDAMTEGHPRLRTNPLIRSHSPSVQPLRRDESN